MNGFQCVFHLDRRDQGPDPKKSDMQQGRRPDRSVGTTGPVPISLGLTPLWTRRHLTTSSRPGPIRTSSVTTPSTSASTGRPGSPSSRRPRTRPVGRRGAGAASVKRVHDDFGTQTRSLLPRHPILTPVPEVLRFPIRPDRSSLLLLPRQKNRESRPSPCLSYS